jgi:hypothetical protein
MKKFVFSCITLCLLTEVSAKTIKTDGVFLGIDEGDFCYMNFKIKGTEDSFVGCEPKFVKIAEANKGKVLEIVYEEKSEFVPEAGQKVLRKTLKLLKVK